MGRGTAGLALEWWEKEAEYRMKFQETFRGVLDSPDHGSVFHGMSCH